MDMNVILQSETKTKYFIGLSPKHFWNLYEFLGPAKFNLKYWGSGMRLRRGVNNMTLAHIYDVSEYLVRTVFTTWIMLMFHHFKELRYRMFPEGKLSKKILQKCFAFSKTFKCGMPRNYSQQGILYSSYNSHCTMKCLIAVNPNGAACFVSDLFVLMMLKFFKSVGLWNISTQMMHFWLIKDLLFNIYCFQNNPPFLGKREKFTKEEVMLIKELQKYVFMLNGLMKD